MNHVLVLHAALRSGLDTGAFDALLTRLPYAKRRELERKNGEDRHASLVGIALALYGLEILSGRRSEPGELRFPQDGKPRLRKGPCFSISHASERVGVALSATSQVGFDIEEPAGRYAAAAGGSDRASGAEQGELASAHPASAGENEVGSRLMRWTAIEAVLKAAGRPLRDAQSVWLDSSLATGRIHGAVYHVSSIAIDGVVAHAATDQPVTSITVREIAPSELASRL